MAKINKQKKKKDDIRLSVDTLISLLKRSTSSAPKATRNRRRTHAGFLHPCLLVDRLLCFCIFSSSKLLPKYMIAVPIHSLGFDMIDMTWFSALLLGAGCLALGYFIGTRHPACIFLSPRALKGAEIVVDGKSKNRGKQPLEIEKLADILEDFKMVLVVRNDLKMGKGKIAAQCSHATLGLYKKLANRAPKSLNRWEMCGQVKVVVKIESEDDMIVLQEKAKSLNLQTHITIDAGRTQIAPNSRTVMSILGPADMVDNVTGGLKLL